MMVYRNIPFIREEFQLIPRKKEIVQNYRKNSKDFIAIHENGCSRKNRLEIKILA